MPTLSIDVTGLLTQAFAIVAALGSLLVVVGGLRLGFRLFNYLLEVVGNVFRG